MNPPSHRLCDFVVRDTLRRAAGQSVMRDVSGGDDAGCSAPGCAGLSMGGCPVHPGHERWAPFAGALPCPRGRGVVHGRSALSTSAGRRSRARCPVHKRGASFTSAVLSCPQARGPGHERRSCPRAPGRGHERRLCPGRGRLHPRAEGRQELTCPLLIPFPDALVWLPPPSRLLPSPSLFRHPRPNSGASRQSVTPSTLWRFDVAVGEWRVGGEIAGGRASGFVGALRGGAGGRSGTWRVFTVLRAAIVSAM